MVKIMKLEKDLLNLAIYIVEHQNIEALENLINCVGCLLPEEELDSFIYEVGITLDRELPESSNWYKTALFTGEELEEELEYFYVTALDLCHMLLDEGFKEGIDFKLLDNRLAVSKGALAFLDDYYEIEVIKPILCPM